MFRHGIAALVFTSLASVACGARSGLEVPLAGTGGSGGTGPVTCDTAGVVTLVSGKYATSHQVPGGLTVDATYVYWIDVGDPGENGSVHRVPKCGGTPETIAKGIYFPGSLAVDGTDVFYTDLGDPGHDVKGGVFKVPAAGGAAIALTEDYLPHFIAVDASNIYWTDAGLASAPKTGGSMTQLSQYSGGSVAIDPSYVYWFAVGLLGPNTTPLARIPKSGGMPEVLSTGEIFYGLAVDQSAAYVGHRISNDAGDLLRISLAGGGSTTLASTTLTSIAIDSNSVYWTDNEGGLTNKGSVKRIAKSGGPVTTIASGESSAIAGIAVDDTHIFWLNDREVMRAPKN